MAAKKKVWKHASSIAIGMAFGIVLGLGGGLPAQAGETCPIPADTSAKRVDVPRAIVPSTHPFEGWGTALAWFANVTGGYPDPVRNQLADLLYGPQGLNWNIARYNIGGGNPAGAPEYLRPGADVPGFWKQPANSVSQDWWRPDDPEMWNWDADPRQRWWLDAIKRRVPQDIAIYEAFSNSPPYFMTISGLVSGADDGLQPNLKPGHSAAFADYLVRVSAHLETAHGIRFRTLSPVNEPGTPYWFAKNRQEGAHWPPALQGEIILATRKAMTHHDLSGVVSAMDETDALTFIRDWDAYPPEVRDAIGQLNVHSYDTYGQTAVRDIATSANKRLWMSEVDLSPQNVVEDFDDMRPPVALAERIILDLKRLEPAAWVFWQAIEDSAKPPSKGSNWGLIKMDFTAKPNAAHPIHVTRKYWAMANFSRYIRPGYRLFPVDDYDTAGAVSPDGKVIVLVHVNAGLQPRALNLNALNLTQTDEVSVVVTASQHNAELVCRQPGARTGPAFELSPNAISTVVIKRRAAS